MPFQITSHPLLQENVRAKKSLSDTDLERHKTTAQNSISALKSRAISEKQNEKKGDKNAEIDPKSTLSSQPKKPTMQLQAIALIAHRIRTNQNQLRQSESLTRSQLINPILEAYGWKIHDPKQVRMEQGTAQPGRPDISLIDPERNVPITALEAKALGTSPSILQKADSQVSAYMDGAGKTNRLSIITDGDKWIFRRPGQSDHARPLAEVQLSQDKPQEAAQTLTRVLRPSSIMEGKMDNELNNADFLSSSESPDYTNQTYVVLDVETTGFSPGRDKIIEFGAVKIINGKEVDSMQTFINPERPIPKQIVELTHINDNMVRNAPTFEQARYRINQFIGTSGPVIAHNASFDKRMLQAQGVGNNIPDNQWYDTMKLSRRIYNSEKQHNLEAITKRLGIYQEGNHRADVDARMTGKAFALMMENTQKMTDDKRNSLIRETSRRKQTPESSLLASTNNSGYSNMTLRKNPIRKPKETTMKTVSGTSKRPISVK